MSQEFPAGSSPNSLKWAAVLALLIDVPFFLTLMLIGGGPDTATVLMMTLFTGISALIVYVSYAAGRMTYNLKEGELEIRFPVSPLKISISRIRSAGKINTSLRIRLFGGSVPGAHFGKFYAAALGTVQAYTTRYKGEFVLMELTDGQKILITPREPDAFIEALNNRVKVLVPTTGQLEEPQLDRRLAAIQLTVVTVAWLALIAFVATVYPGLPNIVPVHFGLDGSPNRYGNKVELFLIAAISTIFPTMNAVFAIKFGKYSKGLTVFLSIVFLLAVGLIGLVVNQIIQAT